MDFVIVGSQEYPATSSRALSRQGCTDVGRTVERSYGSLQCTLMDQANPAQAIIADVSLKEVLSNFTSTPSRDKLDGFLGRAVFSGFPASQIARVSLKHSCQPLT